MSIDTLRADRVGPTLTPTIESLAARGTRFTNARTVAPLTLPAHVSLMTGLRPPGHGVRLNGTASFDPRVPTLARRFKDAGYESGAFVGAYVLDRRFGLAAGFDTYDDQIPRDANRTARLEAERRGEVVVDRAIAWLEQRACDTTPLFLWVHLYDPHAPYTPPQEALARAHGQPYDGEVTSADAQIGRLLATILKARREPLIIVLGDHGESLNEHGEPTHGMLLYEPALKVPLVFSGAGVPVGSRDDPVSLVDVAPTVLARTGLAPPANVHGRDLFAGNPRGRWTDAVAYSETEYPRLAGWSPLVSVTDGRWKLIEAMRPELYDLKRDPGEQRNLAATLPANVQALRSRAEGMRAEERRAETGAGAATSDVARKLRALGYVAGPSAAPSESSPNPADMMSAWSRFEEAVGQLSGSRDGEALRALEELARSHPEAPVFQTTLAAALADRGRHRAALAIYRKVVEHWPGDSMSFHDLAVSARAAGLVAEAMRAERAALAIDERNALAHNGLGLLLVDGNRPGEAIVSFRRALELDPNNPQPAVNLGNALRASGDDEGAERAYRRALDLDPGWPDALNGLAVLLVQRGMPADAIPLLRRALARDPGLVEARLNLGIAAQQAGDLALARESYRAVLRAPAGFERERRAAATLLGKLPHKG